MRAGEAAVGVGTDPGLIGQADADRGDLHVRINRSARRRLAEIPRTPLAVVRDVDAGGAAGGDLPSRDPVTSQMGMEPRRLPALS